jgi:hypothetical protein
MVVKARTFWVIELVEESSRIVAGQQRCRVPFDNFV